MDTPTNNAYAPPQANLELSAEADGRTVSFFDPHERLGRLRYWTYATAVSVGAALAAETIGVLMGKRVGDFSGSYLFTIVTFVLTVVFARRRLFDMGRSPHWAFLMLVPFVNILAGLWLVFAPGDEQANEYGPPPPPNTRGTLIAFWLTLLAFVAFLVGVAVVSMNEG